MKKISLIVFTLALLADIIGVYLKKEVVIFMAKPLVVSALIVYFFYALSATKKKAKKWIVLALLFSWLGDVLLMFESNNKNFFLSGLVAFLIAHLFYIFFFSEARISAKIRLKSGLAVVVSAYYTGLIFLLYNHLDQMKVPVMIYGVAISAMFLLALHMLFIKNKTAGRWMMTGALLFVVSDSALAINKFYQPFEWAGIIVMLTYGSAQLMITIGAVQYITSTLKQ